MAKQNYELAKQDFDKALLFKPDYLEALINRGHIYSMNNSFNDALSDFNKIIAINPNIPEAYGKRAVTYFFMAKFKESESDVKKAQELGYSFNEDFLKALNKSFQNDH